MDKPPEAPADLRDWFAGMAIMGMASAKQEFTFAVPRRAYHLADEMIRVRELDLSDDDLQPRTISD